jgi:pimeloyl-ACP methyl ester carboxylesterase
MFKWNETRTSRWSLPRGCVVRRALRSDPTQEYLLYIPKSVEADPRVLVLVHGLSRNAHEQATVFTSLCEERGVVALVPIFTKELHKDYQRLGRRGRGPRVDLLLHRFLAECATLTGADPTQTFLFGFSAGAQFVHRYVLAHPHRVARAAVAAAGWYTFPDHTQKFPYGTRPSRALAGVTFNPEQFLRVPIEVLVGELDTTNANLRRTDRADAQQGATRLERARRWVAAMQDTAAAHGLPSLVALTEVPGIEHSFKDFCTQGGLVEHVDRALFVPSAATRTLSVVSDRDEAQDRAAV